MSNASKSCTGFGDNESDLAIVIDLHFGNQVIRKLK